MPTQLNVKALVGAFNNDCENLCMDRSQLYFCSLSATFHREGDDSGEVRRGGDLTLVPASTVNNF